MLALGVGNAWGEESFTIHDKFTSTTMAYATTYTADISVSDLNGGNSTVGISVLGVYKQAKAGTTFQTNKKSGHIKNTSAIPGKITKIVVSHNASYQKNTLKVYGAKGQEATTQSTLIGTLGTQQTDETISFETGEYNYFLIDPSTGTGSAQMTSITIYYTSSSGSTQPVASLTANPTSLDFGNVTQNNEVEAKTFTISGSDFTTGELTITAPSGYTVNPTIVPVNGTLEETTITVTPNTSIVGPFNGNVTISGANLKSSVTVALTMTVEKAPATPTENVYVKVTSTEGITDGEYLIVYEDASNATPAPVAFDGSLEALDAEGNTLEVTINNNTIAGTNYIDAATFTIDVTNGTILSASGKYIGKTAYSNGLDSKTEVLTNTIEISEGNAVITASGNCVLRYNSSSGQYRFRYYKSGQQPIALYKKASKHTVTIADCTNGSVSAKMGETALATNDQVLSGIQITLSNEAATNYKLTAYDVYKTDDATTKVTVTDGKFIMPEFDVTISATFELAKTLTGIEITTPATQTTFWKGETFNHEGLKVTAHFDGADDEDVTDKVTVTGSTATSGTQTVTVSFKEGEVTETTTYNITVKATANTKETAYDVATAREIIDKVSTADNVYVTGIVSEIVTPYNSEYGNITYNISADGLTTSNQLQAFRGKSYNGEKFTSDDDIQVGDEVVVFGNLLKYSSTYELNAGNQLVDLKRNKQQPELSYTTTECNVNLGDEFTAPTLNNPHFLAVTYSSNDEDVATVAVDGAVTIKAAGTVVITASFAGNDDYVAGSASYTINITDPNQLEVTFDATQDLDANNTAKGEGKITKSPITFACSDGILGNGEEYRLYQNANITFAAENGYAITKVVLTSTAYDDSQYGPAKLSTEDGTYTYSGKEGTWVGEAYTVTLTASAQTRATLITVYYKQDNRVDAGIAWNPATVSLTVGDAFTAPTFSNPNTVTGITFASDNEALATVNNAGVISLVNGKTGTATITATYAGDATYKAAEATCVINVNPVTDEVVILAQHAGKWYAMMAQCPTGLTERLAALPVEYINGTLYNVTEENKALITWTRAFVDDKVTFQNNGKYLKGKSTTTLILEEGETGLYLWDKDTYTMTINGTVRTFLYSNTNNCFRNYDANQASNGVATDVAYSSLPTVTAPEYATAIEIGSGDNSTVIDENEGQPVNVIVDRAFEAGDEWYTLCVPFNMPASLIGTAYQLSGLVQKGTDYVEVNLAAKTTIEAGQPYLIKPSVSVSKFVVENVTIVNTTGESIEKSISGLSVTMQGVINGTGNTSGLYWVGNSGYLYNDDVAKSGLRTYFNISTSSGIAPRMRVVAGENVETGVEDIITTDAPVKVIENGQLIIIRDGVKYNVQGQKL